MDSKYHVTIMGGEDGKIPLELTDLAACISHEVYDLDKLMDPFKNEPQVILCFSPDCDIPEVEIAQSLRMNYSETAIFYVAFNKKNFNKKILIKNGFSDAFLLPWEGIEFSTAVKLALNESAIPELKNYFPINIQDLSESASLGVSTKIFLPMNNKLVQFSMEDEAFDAQKLGKLQERMIRTLYIHKEDQEKFEENIRQGKEFKLSFKERQTRLTKATRELVSEMLVEDSTENTFEKSRSLMDEIKDLVKMISLHKESKLMDCLYPLIGKETSFYTHLINVCCYSSLFASVLRVDVPHEVALAGLLHDIGKMNKNPDSDPSEMNDFHHPQSTIDLIKSKKMIVSEIVMKAILQHHEAVNGKGYPKRLTSNRISIEAKIVALADRFDELTMNRDILLGLGPLEAMEQIFKENSGDPEQMILDLDLIKSLITELRR